MTRIVMRTASLVLALVASLALTATTASAKSSTKHNLGVYKVEKHLTIDEDSTVSEHVICQNGDLATDGMWRVDQVSYNPQVDDDGPYDRFNDVDVLQAISTSPQEYTFKIRNRTEDDAQVKLFVVCLSRDTVGDTHQHALDVTSPAAGGEAFGAPGAYGINGDRFGHARCPNGSIVIAPGYQVLGGPGHDRVKIFRSYPDHPNNRGWTWGFWVLDPGVSIQVRHRCLRLRTFPNLAHDHKLFAKLRPSYDTKTTALRDRERYKLDCDDPEKAIVGGFDVNTYGWDHHNRWLWYLGMDPQPKSRVFTVHNAWPFHDLDMKLIATCLRGTTGSKKSV